ncbi:MAG: hypothetical protein JWM95_2798 [Gemmatimonadetes bacterium]|nr:hypothetical protein [Gemmatimonadota bacterium]
MSRRRSTLHILPVTLVAFSLIALAACHSATQGVRTDAPRGDGMLIPGSSELVVSHFRDESGVARILGRAPVGDTTERDMGKSTFATHMSAGGTRLHSTSAYSGSGSQDTLVVRTQGLIPETEQLRMRGSVTDITYDGPRLRISIKRGDSTRTYDRVYPEAPFAFNQLEQIVRSLPFRAGFQAVVPLFSEQDAKVEYDTVHVVGRELVAGRQGWRVRFADPVIVSTYVIDEATRELLEQVVMPRRGGRMRYVKAS